uniref:Uncharacterized protein n=1 Tax=Arundo donax TaxID=35708 RepID=A0A0A9A8V7_ARUDO
MGFLLSSAQTSTAPSRAARPRGIFP